MFAFIFAEIKSTRLEDEWKIAIDNEPLNFIFNAADKLTEIKSFRIPAVKILKIKNLLNVENWKRIFRKKEDILKAFRECFLGNFSWNCYDVDIKIFTCDLCSATQCTILPDGVCFRHSRERIKKIMRRYFWGYF